MEIIKLAVVILIIVLLMWRKVDLGLSLLIGSVSLGLIFSMKIVAIAKSAFNAVIEPATIQVVFAVIMIQMMGELMKLNGSLKRMVDSLENLVRDPRWAMSIPPALIGLLPTPGGAMLSAPIVEESSKKLNVSPEQKTFVNYWFRHLWEYFWPLYPGLIVASAILKVPIPNMIRLQYPMTLGAIFCGILFGILNIEKSMNEKKEKSKFFPEFLHFNINIWPIWFILIGLMVIKIPIVFILSSIVIILLIIVKLERKQIWMVFKKSASLKIIVLLFAVMIFKHIVMDSSLVQAIPAMLASSRISSLIPLSIIPFIFGLLTGVNQAYVGVTFPLLLPIFGGVNINLKLAMFAYNSGLFGVLLSPAHLCLLLTKEYFAANWRKIYRKLIPSVLIVFIISVILLFI